MAHSASEASHVAGLLAAQIEPLGWIRHASNQTLLVRLDGDPERLAVYKPDAGERPLYDFPGGTLARREVAAYEVSEWLGWQLVPATVYRDGPEGPGSLQRFVPHDPQRHAFTLVEGGEHDGPLKRLALFDLLVNNADRKASHVLLGEHGVRGCDHGLCFHVEDKLRTVLWDFAGQPLDPADLQALARLAQALAAQSGPRLDHLLAPGEIDALARRAAALSVRPCLPDPPADRRAYPWPLW